MILDNSYNANWHSLHDGKRVPVNEEGALGAPFSMFSIGDWIDGSINTAVRETFLTRNGGDASDYEYLYPGISAGTMTLETLVELVDKDDLYGDVGEARGTSPMSTLPYRGYPTPTIQGTFGPYMHSGYVLHPWDMVGNVDINTTGQYIITQVGVTLDKTLPYDMVFRITSGVVATSILVKIPAGQTQITSAKNELDGDSAVWIAVPAGEVYVTIHTEGLTGSLVVSFDFEEVSQTPYYGDLLSVSYTYSELEYQTPLGQPIISPGFYVDHIRSPECYLTNCKEIDEEYLTINPIGDRFITPSGVLSIGETLYGSGGAVIERDVMMAEYSYTYSTDPLINIRTIVTYLRTDYQGKIVFLEEYPTTYSPPTCWLDSGCA